MTTTQKKVARQLAKALIALDVADWHARDWKQMNEHIRHIRNDLSLLFTSTGYEFGEGSGCRIRQRRAERARNYVEGDPVVDSKGNVWHAA